VSAETAAQNIDKETGKPVPLDAQNAELLRQRTEEFRLVDWEAQQVSGDTLVLQLLFASPEKISAVEGQTDTLHVTLNLEDFTTEEGKFIPRNSLIKRNLPA